MLDGCVWSLGQGRCEGIFGQGRAGLWLNQEPQGK